MYNYRMSGADNWDINHQGFVDSQHNNIELLTFHYYITDQSRFKNFDEMLVPSSGLKSQLGIARQSSNGLSKGYRITECNTYSGHGKDGASNTFASALWVIRFSFEVAFGGGKGIHLHHLPISDRQGNGVPPTYSPFKMDYSGSIFNVAPLYYGMLFSSKMDGSLFHTFVDSECIQTFACLNDKKRIAILNTCKTKMDITLNVPGIKRTQNARSYLLTAPSFQDKSATFGDSWILNNGGWSTSMKSNPVSFSGGFSWLSVPYSSALMIEIDD